MTKKFCKKIFLAEKKYFCERRDYYVTNNIFLSYNLNFLQSIKNRFISPMIQAFLFLPFFFF
jgi:DNA-binding transcriptional regulator GbsR (MarR family)